jgi:hypothetical protein
MATGTAALLSSAVMVAAQQAAPDSTADSADTTTLRTRLPADYAQLSGLSDDEKTKLLEIRAKTDEAIRVLHENETKDMLATLTDDQRTQLAQIQAAQKAKASESRRAAELNRQIQTDQERLNALKDKAATNPSGSN